VGEYSLETLVLRCVCTCAVAAWKSDCLFVTGLGSGVLSEHRERGAEEGVCDNAFLLTDSYMTWSASYHTRTKDVSLPTTRVS
jgi:hypothetical protein